MTAPTITDRPQHDRFELEAEGHTAVLSYRRDGDRLVLLHTDVPPEIEGLGHGSALVRAALEHARREGQRVVPLCPFVLAYLKRHPEYADLVVRD